MNDASWLLEAVGRGLFPALVSGRRVVLGQLSHMLGFRQLVAPEDEQRNAQW